MNRMFKHLSIGLFAASTLLGFAPVAVAEEVQPVPLMVWRHQISDGVEKQRIAKYGVGPFADSTSRLEPELQGSVDLAKMPQLEKLMDELSADGARSESLLGKGYRVVKLNKAPRDVWDRYLDTPDGQLAATNSSLRIRSENGTDQINFKPRGAVRFPNGMAHRVELGVNIPAATNGKMTPGVMKFFRNTKLRDNPLREIPKLYGRDVGEFFEQAVDIKQQRTMYEVQALDVGGNWVKKAEVSLDRVTARDPQDLNRTVSFGRMELEGEHVSLQLTPEQQAKLAGSTWKGPHRASDTQNQALVGSADVKETHRLADVLGGHLGVTAAGVSKYAQGRQMLGKPATAKVPPIRTRAPRALGATPRAQAGVAVKPVRPMNVRQGRN